MPAVDIGSLRLNGVLLDSDPEVYESYVWAKRGSVFKTFRTTGDPTSGVRTQEFGHPMVDLTLELQSGPHQFIDVETVRALDLLYRAPVTEYALEDWLGNELTVIFPPGEPAAFRPKHAQISTLWTYQMRLRVRSIQSWLGQAYSGE